MANEVAMKEESVIVMTDGRESEISKEVSVIELRANGVAISSQKDYEDAAEFTKAIKQSQKKVEEFWEPLRLSTKKAYDDILARKKQMLDPLLVAEKTVKSKMSAYITEVRRIQAEQERERQRLAEEEANRKLDEAIAASEKGDEAAADYAMAEAEMISESARYPSAPQAVPKASGVSTSKAWKITAIDSDKVPVTFSGIELRPVNEKMVMQLIKASKGTIKIPGVTYEETQTISIRS